MPNIYSASNRLSALALSTSAALLLVGCGAGTLAPSTPVQIAVAATQGVVMGGQQPVAGVTLQLYQAGTTGYGSPATALGGTATTTAAGNFNLPSYTCTTGSQVYLAGTGGQPIAATANSTAVTNNNLALMVGLGICGGSGLSSFIDVNEITTVATVWALAPFMVDVAHIGSSANNAAGLANAFAIINQVANTTNGQVSGPTLPAGSTLPIAEIDTLADILEACVNSAGGTPGDQSSCGKLFHLAPDSTGTAYPTDTITAALNIALNPARNVAALNQLRSSSPVFQPALNVNTPPSAWTLAITYTGGGISAPSAVAVDQNGAIWLSNAGNNSVTKLDPTGTPISGAAGFTAGGFNTPAALAIDQSGNAWVANSGNNTVVQLSASGSTATALSGNGLAAPHALAIDASGSVFVANTNTISSFTSTGSALNAPSSGTAVPSPGAIAIDPK